MLNPAKRARQTDGQILAVTGATLLRPERNLRPWAHASRALEETCEMRTHLQCAPSPKARSSLGATSRDAAVSIFLGYGRGNAALQQELPAALQRDD